jgi:hypothetical protein
MNQYPPSRSKRVVVDEQTHEKLRRASFEERRTIKEILERAVKKDLDGKQQNQPAA